MARAIERGATYLDKMCHKLYDEPKGHGFQVDGECRHCGGHLMTYYCEDRLYLIACEKCGALALTKSAAPQVAANLMLRKPTLTPPNEPLTLDSRLTPKLVTCPKGWKGVRYTRFHCPGCKKVLKKGEAYCHKCCQALIFPAARYDKENNRIWLDFSDRRPAEGEEDT